jgi:hypothetical protein
MFTARIPQRKNDQSIGSEKGILHRNDPENSVRIQYHEDDKRE